MYNSVHRDTNCNEVETESKHKKATATCYNLYSIVTSKHDSKACGNGFEPQDGQYLDRFISILIGI